LLRGIRTRLPALAHRRPEAYGVAAGKPAA
jgi:hypothetical protein